jgi:hypothetical protein
MLYSFAAFFFTIMAMLNASMLITADIPTNNTLLPELIQLAWFKAELTVLLSIMISNVVFMLIRSFGKPGTTIDY